MDACMGWQGSWRLRETSCGLGDIFMEYHMASAGSSYLVEVVSQDKLIGMGNCPGTLSLTFILTGEPAWWEHLVTPSWSVPRQQG
jgi:hypothetical protein